MIELVVRRAVSYVLIFTAVVLLFTGSFQAMISGNSLEPIEFIKTYGWDYLAIFFLLGSALYISKDT